MRDTKGVFARLKALWQTDCEYCRRMRLVLLWALVALPLVLWWMSKL